MSVSEKVEIRAIPEYLASESDPQLEKFVFRYHIQITNHRDYPIVVKSRYWLITQGNGNVIEVEGEGVVGQQPKISPGKTFSYISGVMLATPVGTMQGHYVMTDEHGGHCFQVTIPIFRLAMPGQLH